MPDWLADPRWQGIGGILTVIGILVGIAYVRRPRLAWGYTSVPLITVSPGAESELDVRYRGQAIQFAHVQRITVANVGAVAIPRSAWDSPIAVSYPQGKRVIAAELATVSPRSLGVELEWLAAEDGAMREFHVAPLLLNPGDGFNVSLVVDAADSTLPVPEIAARIAGVRNLASFDGDSLPLFLRLVRSTVTTVISMGLFAAFAFVVPQSVRDVGVTVVGVLLSVLAFSIVFAIVAVSLDRFDPYRALRE